MNNTDAQLPPVLPGEDPWTAEEVATAVAELHTERGRLQAEIEATEAAMIESSRDAGDGSGDDQADQGNRTFEREQDLTIVANARDMVDQVERALKRIEAGSYGVCERCGKPIGKARLQAFPRATMCVTCKQWQERHS